MPKMDPARPRVSPLLHALRLRCPACGRGRLFRGLFRMHDGCVDCGLSFRREPGFYLGSIYINYGVTVLLAGGLFALLVPGCGVSQTNAFAVCLAVAVLFPLTFFRHARALLLAIDSTVNRHQAAGHAAAGPSAAPGDLPSDELTRLSADDASAGCMMGIALALVVAFGLVMGLVTLAFIGGATDRPLP